MDGRQITDDAAISPSVRGISACEIVLSDAYRLPDEGFKLREAYRHPLYKALRVVMLFVFVFLSHQEVETPKVVQLLAAHAITAIRELI